MSKRAKKLYCPSCQCKLNVMQQIDGSSRLSMPGVRFCPVCEVIWKVEDCWVTNWSKLGDLPHLEAFFNHITRSDIGFGIPFTVQYFHQLVEVSVPSFAGSINFQIPVTDLKPENSDAYSACREGNSVQYNSGSRLDSDHKKDSRDFSG